EAIRRIRTQTVRVGNRIVVQMGREAVGFIEAEHDPGKAAAVGAVVADRDGSRRIRGVAVAKAEPVLVILIRDVVAERHRYWRRGAGQLTYAGAEAIQLIAIQDIAGEVEILHEVGRGVG